MSTVSEYKYKSKYKSKCKSKCKSKYKTGISGLGNFRTPDCFDASGRSIEMTFWIGDVLGAGLEPATLG